MIVHLLSEVYSYDVSCSIRRAISIATLNLTFVIPFFFLFWLCLSHRVEARSMAFAMVINRGSSLFALHIFR